MPQEPKKKHSKARKRTRRASINLGMPQLITCSNCQEMMIPHQVCKKCGHYNMKQVEAKKSVKVTKA